MTTSNPSPKKLPRDPSVEHLRKQAKALHKAYQQGLAPAAQRVAAVFADKPIKLTDAQHIVAVEYGFVSWPKLLTLVESVQANRTVPKMSSDGKPNRPMQAAARAKDLATVRELLESGQYDTEDLTAGLAGALWYGNPATQWDAMRATADLLIEYGADVDSSFGDYGPIVFGTGECLVPESLLYLIEHDADVTFNPIQTKYGMQCPMSYWLGTYARGKNQEKHRGIRILLEHGAYIPPEVTPEIMAIHLGDAQELAEFIEEDPTLCRRTYPEMPYGNISLRGATLLHCAVEFDEFECCDMLATHGADVNTPSEVIEGVGGQTVIFHTIASGGGAKFPMLEHLIKKYGRWIDFTATATIQVYSWKTGQNETLRDVTPLQMAEANVNPDDKNPWWKTRDQELAILRERDVRSTMERAVEAGDVAAATQLMDRHPKHLGPHLWAAAVHEARSLDLVNELVKRGLDPNARADPRSALDLACYIGNAEMITALVAAGAKVDVVNELGERPADLLGRYEPIDDATSAACRSALGLDGDWNRTSVLP